MLTGAALFIAQVGAHKIRRVLTRKRKTGALERIRPDSVGTAAHFSKALGQASILEVINFIDKEKGDEIAETLLQHANDLDDVQELLTSLSTKASLNPSLNAVVNAFSRRRFKGCFKTEGQSVELDTLLQQTTKSKKDKESYTASTSRRFDRLCYAFQRESCAVSSCNFSHRCSLCYSYEHGAIRCTYNSGGQNATHGAARTPAPASRPPHPRYRRDRANNA